jgi:hypothetical protein
MVKATRPHSLLRRCISYSVIPAALAASAVGPSVHPQGTRLWTQSRVEEFEKGTPQGVALTSDGEIREGPGLKEVLTTPSTFVWSVAVDKSGTAYVGTGSPATVQRIGADGKPMTLFETHDLAVQVVRVGPDGSVYAATMPSGKVFKLKPGATAKQDESSATVVFDASRMAEKGNDSKPENKPAAKAATDKHRPDADKDKPDADKDKPDADKDKPDADKDKPDADKDKSDADKDKSDADKDKSDADKDKSDDKAETKRYIWDMTFDAAGRLYIATGGPAAIYRVDPAKTEQAPEEFFKSDEQHIRALAWDAKGNLIAGTDGTGLVYRIGPEGKGYVLFEAPRREIPALAIAADGAIFAASVGDKTHNPLPPLPVQGAGMVTITVVQPGSLQSANASSSAPEGTDIYAIEEGQAPRKVWSGKDEVVYALAARADGILAITGNRGRIFRIQGNGNYADVGHLEAQQGLCMAASGDPAGDILIGTGNTGKLVRFGIQGTHEYASDVLDAGAMARFGRIEVEPGSTGFELFTRSGNIEQPVRGWTDWKAVANNSVASPAGRFLQWKAALHPGGSLSGVGVNYLPVNAAPMVDDVVVVTGARLNPQVQAQTAAQPATVSIQFPTPNQPGVINFDANNANNNPIAANKDRTGVTARWAAHDDNGDDLTFSLYLRGDGEHEWRLLKDNIADRAYSFDQTLIPDGGYQLKVVASDSPSHTPGDALIGDKVSERFEIDTTPPVVTGLQASAALATCAHPPCPAPAHVTFDAEDAMSPVVRAEYSLDAGPWQYIEPVGGLSDARREHYDFTIPATAFEGKSGEQLLTVRVYDRHENVGLAKTLFGAAMSSAK